MFVDFEAWPPHRPWEPPPRKPRLSVRGERVIVWSVFGFLLVSLLAPIGGATLVGAAMALLKARSLERPTAALTSEPDAGAARR